MTDATEAASFYDAATGRGTDEVLHREILDFIGGSTWPAALFERLALRLFARQFQRNPPYRRLCEAHGRTPASVRRWKDVPAAPAAAFKAATLTCVPAAECTVEFHSSGTTRRHTSRHLMDTAAADLYRRSLRRGYDLLTGSPAELPMWALLAPPESAPTSSLSFMVADLMARCPNLGHRWFCDNSSVLPNQLLRALNAFRLSPSGSELSPPAAQSPALSAGSSDRGNLSESHALGIASENRPSPAGEPILLFGTAFAFIHLFDALPSPVRMPLGSRVIETGGFKGRSRQVDRPALYRMFRERLGVLEEDCLSEYGMCEMASQFYDSTWLDRRERRRRQPVKLGPPWVRTQVIDPVTGEVAPPGHPGALCHFDLANWNSVAHVLTEDWGVARDEGFDLLGRAPGAELRGCSLLADDDAGSV